ncbi:MAG TPA: DUF3307 domain-containing protein [Niabella sp.]|nr:DUF3307 domain-containing protein [Chitinophagaceae bacterium]HRO84672.1 DUF3307 domain-containing protein [Niabella sp.]
MILLLKMVLAHLIGDFVLQPAVWVNEKERLSLHSPKFYLHLLIHFSCMVIITWDVQYVPGIALITVIHGIIDYLKIIYQKNRPRIAFFLDQFLHLITLVLFVYFYDPNGLAGFKWNNTFLPVLVGLVWLTTPCSIVIKTIISFWSLQIQFKSTDIETKSLQNAGKIIGVLERLLVFAFILTNHWEAVGFLITAKSVFRFSDLKIAQDRKLTEYILIGTLLSFGLAIIAAIITKQIMVWINA